MRIAYFIALHHKLSQFRWLFDAIHTTDDRFLIHIDHKSGPEFYKGVRSYVGACPNVSFLPRRAVNWGGWTQVRVELDAMKVLLASEPGWDYFINLSGQDYPIKSLEFIKATLRAEYPRNFIRVWPFSEIEQREPDDLHLRRRLVLEVFHHVIRTRIRLPFPSSIDIKYKGSSWHMLSRDFCQWLLTSPMTKRIQNLTKHTACPDEIFFQALIVNSPFKDSRTEDCGREVVWPGPKTLRMEDYDRLTASSSLFARKFDDSVDNQVLLHLARDHGFQIPRGIERLTADADLLTNTG